MSKLPTTVSSVRDKIPWTRKKTPLPPGAIGKVDETDRQTIAVTVEPNVELHHNEFIQVPFTKTSAPDQTHILIAQIEEIIGKGVKIGAESAQGQISILGIANARIVQTHDVEETRVRLTAKIISFIDPSQNVTIYDPSTDYLSQPAFRADENNLALVFSKIDDDKIAELQVGTVLGTGGVPVALDPTGFMRHTAIFGQSGSGKSFSFGIVLEELLLKTEARILVFDPNSDYRSFNQLRGRDEIRKHSKRSYSDDDHGALMGHWEYLKKRFRRYSFHPDPADSTNAQLSLLFSDLKRADQCRLLGLDPVLDYEEYGLFGETLDALGRSYTLSDVTKELARNASKIGLLQRLQNREIDELRLWDASPSRYSVIDHLRKADWQFASVDLKAASPLERSISASAILEALYRDMVAGKASGVTFFVVDEAHNLCPRMPWDMHQNAPMQILHEIAAEGRKYGAFLMLMTQNPSKLSEQALIQCDNIILMKMTSGVEVRALEAIVQEAGPRLARKAFALNKGEGICMGGIAKKEITIKFDLRKTQPGGEDVDKGWAYKRVGSPTPPSAAAP